MKKIFKYSKILFINFILIVYLTELFLFLFLPDAQKRLVKIHETRLSIAKELGADYDLRSPEVAFLKSAKIIQTYLRHIILIKVLQNTKHFKKLFY